MTSRLLPLLALAIVLPLTGCGEDDDNSAGSKQAAQASEPGALPVHADRVTPPQITRRG
jgi:hypothetical protein